MNRTAVVSGTSTPPPNLPSPALPHCPADSPQSLLVQLDDGDAGIGGALGGAIARRLAQGGFRIVGLARNVQVMPPSPSARLLLLHFLVCLRAAADAEQAGAQAMAAFAGHEGERLKIVRSSGSSSDAFQLKTWHQHALLQVGSCAPLTGTAAALTAQQCDLTSQEQIDSLKQVGCYS
jgi:hypothetical protein